MPGVHKPEGEHLSLFLGRPVGGQDLLAGDGIGDNDIENFSALANVGGQAETLVAEGGYQGVVGLRIAGFYQFGSSSFQLLKRLIRGRREGIQAAFSIHK